VKCSLLTLSIFIDGELPDDRRSEVDAHLVGCPRCSAGAATLREEKARVGQLARVHVDPGSAQSMLEQVGIAVESGAPLAPSLQSPLPPRLSPAADQLPWQGGLRSPALPWTPRRPDAAAPAMEEPAMSTTTPDVQPDLPLDSVGSPSPSWPPETAEVVAASLEMDAPAPSESWEAALPPPVEMSPDLDEPWDGDHNKKLIARMPAVFRSSADPKLTADGKTTYLAPIGDATMWPGAKGVRISEVTDGTSNTIFLVDANDDHAVVWTKPEDLDYDAKAPMTGLGGRYHGGFLVSMADGSVRLVNTGISKTTLQAAFTRNGGEVLGSDW